MIGIFKINLGNNQPKLRQKIRIIYFRIVTIGKNPHLWNSVFTTLDKQWQLGKSVSGNSPILFSERKPGQAWLSWLEFEGPPQKVAKLLPARCMVPESKYHLCSKKRCQGSICRNVSKCAVKPKNPESQSQDSQESRQGYTKKQWVRIGNWEVMTRF